MAAATTQHVTPTGTADPVGQQADLLLAEAAQAALETEIATLRAAIEAERCAAAETRATQQQALASMQAEKEAVEQKLRDLKAGRWSKGVRLLTCGLPQGPPGASPLDRVIEGIGKLAGLECGADRSHPAPRTRR
mmetsp:Transcript_70709/g.193976  ORF Transcript_70709/g.193976 Transcript_70709/m.193976 type:complete len:135 (-) Transcript_70709:317-721(-)